MEKDRTKDGSQPKRSRANRNRRAINGPPRVISLQDWKNRAEQKARKRLYQEEIRRMTTDQKKAVLLRVIMSDYITQSEVDLLLMNAIEFRTSQA
jgi:hypothetical protein